MVDIRLIAGVGFAAFLVIFLVIAFFWLKTINQGQWAILRFLCALCAGGAGAFLTGEAVFNLRGQLSPGTDFAVSGSQMTASATTLSQAFRELTRSSAMEIGRAHV